MKLLLVILSLLTLPTLSQAIDWEIIDPNTPNPLHKGSVDVSLDHSVGEVTLSILKANGVPYSGSAEGIQSILGTPTGDAALVVVSNEEMRAYGWCFSIDGKIPDTMPDKVFFESQKSKLRWFFAFSVFLKGEWTEYCVPAYQKPLGFSAK